MASTKRFLPTTCFETFPFPEATEAQREVIAAADSGSTPAAQSSRGAGAGDALTGHREAIAVAARELNELREAWLNPPEWVRTEVLEFPGSVDGPWRRYIDPESTPAASSSRGAGAIGTVKYPRLVPKDEECAKQLKKRTLTNLYNDRPTWLDRAHQKLDAAVFAAYGWDPDMSDDELLAALLQLNLERAGDAQGRCLRLDADS